MNNQKGFSLIELMIVVVIIGILSTIAVPQYQRFQAKAKQAEAKSNLSGLYTAMQAFSAEWNTYYNDFRALGFELTGDLNYDVGFSAGVAGPPTHPVVAYRAAATRIRASQLCGTAATSPCRMQNAGTVKAGNIATFPGNVINNGATPRTFIAGADGDIDADTTRDRWQMNQSKQFTQPVGAIDLEQ